MLDEADQDRSFYGIAHIGSLLVVDGGMGNCSPKDIWRMT